MINQKISQDMIVNIELKPFIYTEEGSLDALLERIEAEVDKFGCDISSVSGRKEVASNAYMIARSKTALDGLGKEMVAEWKNKAKEVDRKRKYVRERLDALKAKYRAPLTEWEDSERKRHETIEENISRLKQFTDLRGAHGVKEVEAMIAEVQKIEIEPTYYAEHTDDAELLKKSALMTLENALTESKKMEKEKAELAKLRKEVEERKQKEAEEKQKQREKEIAEKAAQEAAEAERKKVEKALAEKEKAEQEAADMERQRMMDVAHRQKVRKEVVAAFCRYGLTKAASEVLFDAIDKGNIQHVGIVY